MKHPDPEEAGVVNAKLYALAFKVVKQLASLIFSVGELTGLRLNFRTYLTLNYFLLLFMVYQVSSCPK